MIDLDGSASWDFLSYVLKTKSELQMKKKKKESQLLSCKNNKFLKVNYNFNLI